MSNLNQIALISHYNLVFYILEKKYGKSIEKRSLGMKSNERYIESVGTYMLHNIGMQYN